MLIFSNAPFASFTRKQCGGCAAHECVLEAAHEAALDEEVIRYCAIRGAIARGDRLAHFAKLGIKDARDGGR